MSARTSRARRAPSGGFTPTLTTLVGSTFVGRLTDTSAARAPLRIGTQVWSTQQLGDLVRVTNVRAARLLTIAVEGIPGVKNVRDLYDRTSPGTFALRGLGETTVYVLWRLFESQGLDPYAWTMRGREADEPLVSFHAMKQREAVAEARAAADEKARARSSRRRTHEAGVAALTP